MSSATRKDSKKPASSRDGQQLFVGDDDGCVDRLHQLRDAALGLLHAALAFEGEGLGHDGDRERAHLAGERGDDGSRAGAGASAQAGGDEHHVGAFEGFDDLVGVFERGLAADFGIGAGAQAVGELDAELDLHGRARHAQRLQVGVGDDEFDALHAGVDHAVDGVAAASAYTDHFDLGVVAGFFVKADANVVVFFHVRHPVMNFISFNRRSPHRGSTHG